MKKNYDDSNWREEYLTMKVLSEHATDLLKNGARSLSGSWYLAAMHNDWMKKKGYKNPEPPNCQSSFKEWNKSVDD